MEFQEKKLIDQNQLELIEQLKDFNANERDINILLDDGITKISDLFLITEDDYQEQKLSNQFKRKIRELQQKF